MNIRRIGLGTAVVLWEAVSAGALVAAIEFFGTPPPPRAPGEGFGDEFAWTAMMLDMQSWPTWAICIVAGLIALCGWTWARREQGSGVRKLSAAACGGGISLYLVQFLMYADAQPWGYGSLGVFVALVMVATPGLIWLMNKLDSAEVQQ